MIGKTLGQYQITGKLVKVKWDRKLRFASLAARNSSFVFARGLFQGNNNMRYSAGIGNMLKAFVLCLAFHQLFLAGVQAAIPQQERDALIALYNSTNGAGWTDNTGWLGAPGTECGWYGVTCDVSQTSVIQIRLYSNQLSGSIPAELGNLSSLQWLDLYQNQLSGM